MTRQFVAQVIRASGHGPLSCVLERQAATAENETLPSHDEGKGHAGRPYMFGFPARRTQGPRPDLPKAPTRASALPTSLQCIGTKIMRRGISPLARSPRATREAPSRVITRTNSPTRTPESKRVLCGMHVDVGVRGACAHQPARIFQSASWCATDRGFARY